MINYDKIITKKLGEDEFQIEKYIDTINMTIIVNAMLTIDEPIERDRIRDYWILAIQTNLDQDRVSIDEMRACGAMKIITDTLLNYDDINAYVDKYESVNRTVKLFLDEAIIKVDGLTKIAKDLTVSGKIEEIVNSIKTAVTKATTKIKAEPKPKTPKTTKPVEDVK